MKCGKTEFEKDDHKDSYQCLPLAFKKRKLWQGCKTLEDGSTFSLSNLIYLFCPAGKMYGIPQADSSS